MLFSLACFLKILLRAALATISAVAVPALAETQSYAGRTIVLDRMPGFCPLGDSLPERESYIRIKQETAGAGELAAWIAPCQEVEEVRAGKRQTFSQWNHILIQKSGEAIKPVTVSREEYIRTAANALRNPRDAENRFDNGDYTMRSDNPSAGVTRMSVLGSTNDAVFTQATFNTSMGVMSRQITSVVANTTVNQLPVAIYSVAFDGVPANTVADTARAYVRLVIDKTDTFHLKNPFICKWMIVQFCRP